MNKPDEYNESYEQEHFLHEEEILAIQEEYRFYSYGDAMLIL